MIKKSVYFGLTTIIMMSLVIILLNLFEQEKVHAEIMVKDKPVSSEKVWTVSFNTEMDLESAKSSIEVTEVDGTTFSDVSISYGDNKREIVVKPNHAYEYQKKYILRVNEGIESLEGQKLQNATSMRFEIETVNPVKYSESVFSNQYAEIKNDKVYFKGELGDQVSYLLSDKTRPKLNDRLINLSKALIDEESYLGMRHRDKSEKYEGIFSKVFVEVSPGKKYYDKDNVAFTISLYENEGYNAAKAWNDESITDNAEVSMNIDRLWYDIDKVNKETYSEPFYEDKLKESLRVLYPEHAEEIYTFLFDQYVKGTENYEELKHKPLNKTFGNLKVDIVLGLGSLKVYFSVVGE